MRIFAEPNFGDGFVCPICKTEENKPVTLVGILNTLNENKMEAVQVHIDCLELVFVSDEKTGKKAIVHIGDL